LGIVCVLDFMNGSGRGSWKGRFVIRRVGRYEVRSRFDGSSMLHYHSQPTLWSLRSLVWSVMLIWKICVLVACRISIDMPISNVYSHICRTPQCRHCHAASTSSMSRSGQSLDSFGWRIVYAPPTLRTLQRMLTKMLLGNRWTANLAKHGSTLRSKRHHWSVHRSAI
jgi:hypothetical protein